MTTQKKKLPGTAKQKDPKHILHSLISEHTSSQKFPTKKVLFNAKSFPSTNLIICPLYDHRKKRVIVRKIAASQSDGEESQQIEHKKSINRVTITNESDSFI